MKSILLCVLVLCLFAAYSAEENLFTADLDSADVDFLFQQSMRVFRSKDEKGFRKNAVSRDLSTSGFKRTPEVKAKSTPKPKVNHFRTKKLLKTLPTFAKVKKAMLKGKGRKVSRKGRKAGRKGRKSSRKGRKASRKFGRKGRKSSRKGRKSGRKGRKTTRKGRKFSRKGRKFSRKGRKFGRKGRKAGRKGRKVSKKPAKVTFRKHTKRNVSKPKVVSTKKPVHGKRKASRKGRKGKKLTGLAKQLADNTQKIKILLQQKSKQIHKLFKAKTEQLKKKFRKCGRKGRKSSRKAARKASRKSGRKSSRKGRKGRKAGRKGRKSSRKGRKASRKSGRKSVKSSNKLSKTWKVKYVNVRNDQGNPFSSRHVKNELKPSTEDLNMIQE
jgi:hypothetical protein